MPYLSIAARGGELAPRVEGRCCLSARSPLSCERVLSISTPREGAGSQHHPPPRCWKSALGAAPQPFPNVMFLRTEKLRVFNYMQNAGGPFRVSTEAARLRASPSPRCQRGMPPSACRRTPAVIRLGLRCCRGPTNSRWWLPTHQLSAHWLVTRLPDSSQ